MIYRKMKSLMEEVSDLEAAQDPNTHPDKLEILAKHPTKEVRRAVIGNPSTSMDVLLANAHKHPKTFLQNPVFPLLALERPDLFNQIKSATSFINADPSLVHVFSNSSNRDHRSDVAKHPSATQDIINKLSQDEDPYVKFWAKNNRNFIVNKMNRDD